MLFVFCHGVITPHRLQIASWHRCMVSDRPRPLTLKFRSWLMKTSILRRSKSFTSNTVTQKIDKDRPCSFRVARADRQTYLSQYFAPLWRQRNYTKIGYALYSQDIDWLYILYRRHINIAGTDIRNKIRKTRNVWQSLAYSLLGVVQSPFSVHQIFTRCRGISATINGHIYKALLHYVSERQSKE